MTYRNYINLDSEEIDKPIYRIMPVHRLLQCLKLGQLVLVPPRKWDDPFENLLLSSSVRLTETGELGGMGEIRDKVYGQCWTFHRETDAMWRIYSANRDGAKVKSTLRKLLSALGASDPQHKDVTCFIGKVKYHNQKDLVQILKGINLFENNGSGVAESLLYKRIEFKHEKEVRLVYTEGRGAMYVFNFKPNELFEEIIFDPRLDEELCEAYMAATKAKGFTGRVAQSVLYQVPSALQISFK